MHVHIRYIPAYIRYAYFMHTHIYSYNSYAIPLLRISCARIHNDIYIYTLLPHAINVK